MIELRTKLIILIPILSVCVSASALFFGKAIISRTSDAVVPSCPHIEFSEISYEGDFVPLGSTIAHTFHFSNKGNDTLTIRNVSTSCGCLATLLSNSEIRPGGQGRLEASLMLKRAGPNRSTITVESNDPYHPKTLLEISGQARIEFTIQPSSLNFGGIPPGTTKLKTVTIRHFPRPEEENSPTTYVESSSKFVTPRIKSEKRCIYLGGEGQTFDEIKLEVLVRSDGGEGSFKETIIVHVNKGKGQREIEIPVSGKLLPSLTVTPGRMFFGAGSKSRMAGISRTVTVRSVHNR